jgi:hypothetical protein
MIGLWGLQCPQRHVRISCDPAPRSPDHKLVWIYPFGNIDLDRSESDAAPSERVARRRYPNRFLNSES